MGNKVSLKIVLDHDDCSYVHTQGIIAGQVQVIVREKVPTQRMSIELHIRETAVISRGESNDITSNHSIQRATKVLKQESKKDLCQPGVYYFPFQFIIPGSLPPTIGVKRSNESFAITYTLTLKAGELTKSRELDVLGHSILDEMRSKKNKAAQKLPEYVPVSDQNATTIGGVAMGMIVASQILGKGQKMVCTVACRNLCPLNIAKVRVCLVQQHYWTASEKGSALEFVEEHIVRTAEGVEPLPGVKVKATTSTDPNSSQPPTPTSITDRLFQKMMRDLGSSANLVEFMVPTDHATWDSYSGTLVCIAHFLRLECELENKNDDGCSDNNYKVRIDVPVTIGETETTLHSKLTEKRHASLVDTAAAAAAAATAATLAVVPASPRKWGAARRNPPVP